MLPCQRIGWSKESGLLTSRVIGVSTKGSDKGLSSADITLEKAVHDTLFIHVIDAFIKGLLLVARK